MGIKLKLCRVVKVKLNSKMRNIHTDIILEIHIKTAKSFLSTGTDPKKAPVSRGQSSNTFLIIKHCIVLMVTPNPSHNGQNKIPLYCSCP